MQNCIHGGDIYRNKNVLDFSANMNPLGTPESVIKAAADSMKDIKNYPDIRCSVLRTKLAEYESVPEYSLIFGNGAAELIFALINALKPDNALTAVPSFAEYEQALVSAGCKIEYYTLKQSNCFSIGRDFAGLISDDTDIVMLCNPNNPTGVLIDAEILSMIVSKCCETGTFLMIDECFLDFVDGGNELSLKHKAIEYDNVFILKAFTKRYAMAGIRLGYGICGSRAVTDKMIKALQPWNVSIPAQAAGTAALGEDEYVGRAMNLIAEEKKFLMKGLSDLGYDVFDSKANYIFFKAPADLYDQALSRGILIRDCGNYRGLSGGYFRIAVKTHSENEQLIKVFKGCSQ